MKYALSLAAQWFWTKARSILITSFYIYAQQYWCYILSSKHSVRPLMKRQNNALPGRNGGWREGFTYSKESIHVFKLLQTKLGETSSGRIYKSNIIISWARNTWSGQRWNDKTMLFLAEAGEGGGETLCCGRLAMHGLSPISDHP